MSRYTSAHINPEGPGDARPTALQIVTDNNIADKLNGKVAVVTGCSAGLGIEVVRALAVTGITLYLTARDIVKAKNTLTDKVNVSKIHFVKMDQTSLQSVREAANTILSKTHTVNILINNAGIMAIPELQLTKDGFEVQFATNHLSHFLFFGLLKPALLAATTPEFQSRVVILSAAAHRIQGLNPSGDYFFKNTQYDPWRAYAQSKCANIYMANEIERRFGARGLHATSLHPGIIVTGLSKFVSPEIRDSMLQDQALLKTFKNPEQGAATTIYAAIDKDWEGRGGKYLVNCTEAVRGPDDGYRASDTYVSHTYCPELEAQLWRDSLELVGLEETTY
ncbi:dehydrogenase with different specificitie [Talaromyces proteolyticus]|uniref:Dehydrogenase with different specificitie n=1 Tax=Talaromyces proteolyticus TaxID=1131652 RepID=A0AAD4PV69_9EURO|nr:dehydrogenase with different specificitie [Talaromyces proteolyticus]KAH8690311.1 dehydrogenase with different specificitie [Talaromyces proteolyticus]